MSLLSNWLRCLVGASIVMGFLELLLPEGEMHRVARMVMGLVVLLLLVQPLASLLHGRFDLERALANSLAEPAAAADPKQQGARVADAGLAALKTWGGEELAGSLRAFCDEQGFEGARISVSAGADGQWRVRVELAGQTGAARLRELILARYALSAAMVEVKVIG